MHVALKQREKIVSALTKIELQCKLSADNIVIAQRQSKMKNEDSRINSHS